MTISHAEHQKRTSRRRQILRLRLATLVMLGIVLLMGALSVAWFAGEGTINMIFQHLDWLQRQPPIWLEVPMMAGNYLLFWAVALFLVALVVMRLCPEPCRWSQVVVVSILLVLMGRYVLWRSLTTLNLADPRNGIVSLGLFLLEMLLLTTVSLQLVLMLRQRDRRQEADEMAAAVTTGDFQPTVDVLIPTYDEPEFILRRTVIGCQALNYPQPRIYLLDDTRRPHIQALAAELGCEYITRPDNRHAKAGNLNHALPLTDGELIVVFDADFVPTRNFLQRTVGFFQNPTVGLVQTPQSFYNADPIARNLGLDDTLNPEEEAFYRQVQPIRDSAGSAICAGSSFVVRRSALEAVGGFVTDSISEDYFTGVKLTAEGYRLVYLDEKLSAGLAAEDMAAYATQRLRWGRGVLQAFFIQSNPLTIRGLGFWQRLAHLEGILHWFTAFPRIAFLLAPLAYSFLYVIPVRATPAQVLYFFVPYYLMQMATFSWLNRRASSALLSDIYTIVLAFPLALTVIQVFLRPFGRGFRVTPKGHGRDRYSFNWQLATPLLILFVLTAISLWRNLGLCLVKDQWLLTATVPDAAEQLKGLALGWFWSLYNLVMLAVTLLVLLDAPNPDRYEWFKLRRTVQLQVPDPANPQAPPRAFWGTSTLLSAAGAEVALTQSGLPDVPQGDTYPIQLTLLEDELTVPGLVTQVVPVDGLPTVRVRFTTLSLAQQRSLIPLLYCRPGQWRRRRAPSELRSLWLLLRILLFPRILFDRKAKVRALTVAQG